MAMPVVALLLTGGDGIADDGDGDDSDCGEDKLHDGGKGCVGDSVPALVYQPGVFSWYPIVPPFVILMFF